MCCYHSLPSHLMCFGLSGFWISLLYSALVCHYWPGFNFNFVWMLPLAYFLTESFAIPVNVAGKASTLISEMKSWKVPVVSGCCTTKPTGPSCFHKTFSLWNSLSGSVLYSSQECKGFFCRASDILLIQATKWLRSSLCGRHKILYFPYSTCLSNLSIRYLNTVQGVRTVKKDCLP